MGHPMEGRSHRATTERSEPPVPGMDTGRQALLLCQATEVARQLLALRREPLPFDVLHRQVHPAPLAWPQDLDDLGMGEPQADLLLAQEALVEDDVALVLDMRHLEHDPGTRLPIDSLEDRGHPAPRQDVRELVLIDLVSNAQLTHLVTA